MWCARRAVRPIPRYEFIAGERARRWCGPGRWCASPSCPDSTSIPFVLVDVELAEQADLRLIGRLLDGVEAELATRRAGSGGLRGSDGRNRGSRIRVGPMIRPMQPGGRCRLRAQHDRAAQRTAPSAPSRSTRPGRRSPMRGSPCEQVDGFVSSSLLPSAGGRQVVDGVSIVSSAWLARSLGASPRYVAGFDGIGQLSGSVGMAVNARRSAVPPTTSWCTAHCTIRRAATTAIRCARSAVPSSGQHRRDSSGRSP